VSEIPWPLLTVAGLGVYHGVNPGMGWLLAVACGLQERRRRAVLAALLPIAAGHELSVVVVLVVVALTQALVPPHTVRLASALALAGLGLHALLRPRSHLRGMPVGALGLGLWSFMMSSAHGAGLMLAPVVLGLPVAAGFADIRQLGMAAAPAAAVHAAAMATTMALIAVPVYEKVGLGLLRRRWFSLDRAWSAVLVSTAAVTLFT